MKLIDVSTPKFPNTFAKVDDEDFERLNKHKWSASKPHNVTYAIRIVRRPDGRKTTARMHIEVLGKGSLQIDHADGDGLNNQRSNLRPCSPAQNQQNRRKTRGASKYKGVFRCCHPTCSGSKPWFAKAVVNGRPRYAGHHATEEEAARAYDAIAREHFGEFAALNFKPEDACQS